MGKFTVYKVSCQIVKAEMSRSASWHRCHLLFKIRHIQRVYWAFQSAYKYCVNKKWILLRNLVHENKYSLKRRNEKGNLKAVLLVFISGPFSCFYSEGFHAKKEKAWEYLQKPCLKQPVWCRVEDCPELRPLGAKMHNLETLLLLSLNIASKAVHSTGGVKWIPLSGLEVDAIL